MIYRLSDICDYVKGKVDISKLDLCTYISTESMLPNKAGIIESSSLPNIKQTQIYCAGDVLVSNIRPYFKKIWYATCDGGCSNDVLVFRAKNGVSKRFLYYVLADDKFFSYSMLNSKGTKMPRGDKRAIMEYKVPKFSYDEQVKIANILGDLDDKVAVNNEINRNLSEQAQAIYESWFISFEKFGGVAPIDWREGVLGDIAEIKTTTFKPDKEPDVIVEHYSIPALDEKHFPVFELAEGIKSNKYLLNKNSVMISKLNPDTKRIWRPLCLSNKPVCSTEFIVFEAKNKKNKDFIFSILDSDKFSNHLCSHVTGSTGSRQRAVPKATLDFKVLIPPLEVIEQFCSMVTPIYDLIGVNEIENQRLSVLRDSLLPKLMSGELDISDFDI